MSGLSFGHAWVLAVLPLVPVVFAAWYYFARRGARPLTALSRVRPRGPRVFAAACFALAAACAITAAALPRWGTRASMVPRTGAQVVVVLDVSRSMGGADVAPTRLEAAKSAINNTIGRLGGDRFGLVIFAGDARLRIPLTTDFVAATQIVSSVQPGSLIVGTGTSASSGLDVALTAFDTDSGGGKLLVLITDGEDLGADPAAVAQRVRDAGIELLVVGAGTPDGATVPIFDAREGATIDKLDASGAPIVTHLNEPFLRTVAAAAGGRYLGADLRALPGAVDGRLGTLQRARIEQQAAQLPVERLQWFAAAALASLVLGWLAESRPALPRLSRRVALAPVALLAVLVGGCATETYNLNEAGRDALAAGDADRAVESFTAAQQQRPDDARITLNLAAALHAAGRYDEANIAARRALGSRDPEVRARAQASIGHHRFALGDLPGALAAFREALLEDGDDDASRHDYEVVLRLLQPPPAEQPGQQGDGEEGEQGEQGEQGTEGGQGEQGEQGEQGGPGEQGGQGQQPGAPGPSTPGEADRQVDALDARIAGLLRDAGDEPTPTQALEILRLLAERDRLAASRDALGGGGDPNDH